MRSIDFGCNRRLSFRLETGVPFDLEMLGGTREKKAAATAKVAAAPAAASEHKAPEVHAKAVGWQYRYRVSKMREAQKREALEGLSKPSSKKREHTPIDARLDPELARLTAEERVVGWAYR